MSEHLSISEGSILYLSHGGGPLPLLGDPAHKELADFLRQVPDRLITPSAIVVISAHWEESKPTVTSGAVPPLIYDYSGFPPDSYEIKYPATGRPELAGEIIRLLQQNGIDAVLNAERGFDHGMFVPLKQMYPNANIPCVQLSLVKGLKPEEHIRLGEPLSELKKNNVLIIGSGFSFHNMRAFFAPPTKDDRDKNEVFEKWLIETCTSASFNEAERKQRLVDWAKAPAARYCHPREEHLLPLHVCYGAAGTAARLVYELEIMNKKASMYIW